MRLQRLLPSLSVLALAMGSSHAQSIIDTIAGNGAAAFAGDGGPAKAASLSLPVFVSADASGNIYIADQNNDRIRKVNPQGMISTFAGSGSPGFGGDGGPASAALFFLPTGVFADALGNVFIADVGNSRIRKVSPNGTIATVVGSGLKGYAGDGGPAASAELFNPVRVIVDNAGVLYIADQSNHRVRKVDTSGIITTVAGSGAEGFSGDRGPATSASLDNPTAVALDGSHNLYISDQFNHRIRKVDSTGTITTVAGNGSAGFAGDGGPAVSASLNFPGGLVVDTAGTVFFSDDLNFRVRAISPAGVITTIAGNGIQTFSGDGGPAAAASLNGQFGLAIDRSGNLLISDSANNRIRSVASASPVTPVFPAAGVTNAASFVSGGSAGALGTIFGVHLTTNVQGVVSATATPLPVSLGGTTVTVNGIPAPLIAVANVAGAEQINFQMPWEVAGQSTVSVVVDNGTSANAAVTVPVQAAQPGIFSGDGIDGAIEHLDGTLVSAASPAAAGEYVVVFATGLGPTTPAVPTGQPAPLSPLSNTAPATATIAGQPAPVVFSGQAPFFVGLNQLNVQVPAGTPSGAQDLIVSLNTFASKPVKIAVK